MIIINVFIDMLWSLLYALYRDLGASLVMSVLFMFGYMTFRQWSIKEALKKWIGSFKTSRDFRKMFCLALYSSLILFRTVFCRPIGDWPLRDIRGTWGIYDSKGALNVEGLLNFALFIPFTILLMWVLFDKKIIKKKNSSIYIISVSGVISLAVALVIEFSQLFFKLGLFQLSDIVFNTAGGVVGGIICCVAYKVKKKR